MKRGDYFAIACALVLLPWLYLSHWTNHGGSADEIRIVDGKGNVIVLPLHTDRNVEVPGPLGASLIQISNGAARFTHSPCQGKFCVHAGWLKAGGDFSACLPNRVSLLVASAAPRFDSVNF